MSVRILVPGGRGQLGTAVAAAARAAAHEVSAPGSGELDVTDPLAVAAAVSTLGADGVVINCAAHTAVDAAETEPDDAAALNATAPRLLARACAETGARLVHVSTDYVYSGDGTVPYEPSDPTGPRSVYGKTKLAGERAIAEELPSAHVVRTAWLYGHRGPNFVATMLRLEGERDTLDVVDDQHGSPTSATDLAAGLVELAARSDVPGGVLHATNSGVTTWCGLAREVFARIGADPSRVRPTTSTAFVRPAPRPAYSVLSPRSWAGAGLTPLQGWQDALGDYVVATSPTRSRTAANP